MSPFSETETDRAAEPESPVNTGVVMVVDDNPANLKLVEDMLRPQGYEVRSFPRGRMALDAAVEAPPDLILLDINMPEMTGFEVCDRLKSNEQLSEIPVIFLSALNALEDRLRGFRSGAVDYVSKPFQLEEVHARVDAHVKLRHFQNQIENDNRRLQELVQAQVKKIATATSPRSSPSPNWPRRVTIRPAGIWSESRCSAGCSRNR